MFDRGSIFGTMTGEASAQPRLVGPAIPVQYAYARSAPVAQAFHRTHMVPSVVPQFSGMGATVLGPYRAGVRPPWPETISRGGSYAGLGSLIGFG